VTPRRGPGRRLATAAPSRRELLLRELVLRWCAPTTSCSSAGGLLGLSARGTTTPIGPVLDAPALALMSCGFTEVGSAARYFTDEPAGACTVRVRPRPEARETQPAPARTAHRARVPPTKLGMILRRLYRRSRNAPFDLWQD
jgi:hypothetical protein